MASGIGDLSGMSPPETMVWGPQRVGRLTARGFHHEISHVFIVTVQDDDGVTFQRSVRDNIPDFWSVGVDAVVQELAAEFEDD